MEGTYFEPFLGGGSSFFALTPERAVLADLNSDLVETFRIVRNKPRALMKKLAALNYSHEVYYSLRAAQPTTALDRAARFIYLNRTCWNGLYRVNAKGEFNVPIGRFSNPQVYDEQSLIASSDALKAAELRCGDFEAHIDAAEAGDLVFLDPPYSSKAPSNGFLRYNNRLFSWEDQRRLANIAFRLASAGCHVIVTNAAHPEIENLYPDFHRRTLSRRSRLAADSRKRGLTSELMFSSLPLPEDIGDGTPR